jgi:DNA-binding transcriptional LysR family regulator
MMTTGFRALDLNLLKVFEALMTEGSVTRAADALSITQPAVSNALARLRAAFGDPLFVRSGSGVSPTQRAMLLWASLGESIGLMRQTLEPQTFEIGRAQGEFSLAMSDYVAGLVVPRLAAHLGKVGPRIRLRTLPNTILDLGTQLENNLVDCALSVYVNEAQHPDHLRSRALWPVEYACFMRRGHPLASARRLTLRQFLNAGHVDVSLAGKAPSSYDLFLETKGLQRKLVASVNHYAVAYEVVRHSDLLGVLPRNLGVLSEHARHLHSVPVPLGAPQRIVSLFWHQRNETVPAHRWLRETLVEMFAADA